MVNTKKFCRMFFYHWSFKMSRHIAPVTDDILGCQIFVTNFTFEINEFLVERFVVVYLIYLWWIERIRFRYFDLQHKVTSLIGCIWGSGNLTPQFRKTVVD